MTTSSQAEDASSAFYLVEWRKAGQLRRVRSIWNGGGQHLMYFREYYYDEYENLVWVAQSSAGRGHLTSLSQGKAPGRTRLDAVWRFDNERLVEWHRGQHGGGSTPVLTTCQEWRAYERSLLPKSTR